MCVYIYIYIYIHAYIHTYYCNARLLHDDDVLDKAGLDDVPAEEPGRNSNNDSNNNVTNTNTNGIHTTTTTTNNNHTTTTTNDNNTTSQPKTWQMWLHILNLYIASVEHVVLYALSIAHGFIVLWF